MLTQHESLQNLGKQGVDATRESFAVLSKGFQTIAAETTDYYKKSFESGSAFIGQLFGAKKLDEAIALQSEFAKQSYKNFVAHSTKVGELMTTLTAEVTKPVDKAVAETAANVTQTTSNAAQMAAKVTK